MSNREFKNMSKGQFHTGSHSGRRTLEKCKFKGKTKNVVYVDVENGETHDVIFIDAPEFPEKGLLGSSTLPKKPPSGSFISIEDDEINVDEAENCDIGGGGQATGGTSSKASYPAFSYSENLNKSKFDEFQVTRGKRSPVKFSKSRRTYSEKTLPTNRFGFDPLYDDSSCDSESSDYESSDRESSDCELMEGSSGNIREQWERAASKKKMFEGVLNGHPGLDDKASGSRSFRDTQMNVEVENTTKQHLEVPFRSTSYDANNDKRNLSTSTASGDATTGDPSLTPEDLVVDLDKAVKQDSPSWCKKHVEVPFCSTSNCANTEKGNLSTSTASGDGTTVLPSEEYLATDLGKAVEQDSPSWCRTPLREEANIFHKNVDTHYRGKKFGGEHSFSDAEVQSDKDDKNDEPYSPLGEPANPVEPQFSRENVFSQEEGEHVSTESFWVNYEEDSLHDTEKLDDAYVSHERVVSPGEDDEMINRATCFGNIPSRNSTNYGRAKVNYKEKPFLGEPSLWSNQPCCKSQVDNDITFPFQNDTSVSGGYAYHNHHIERVKELIHESVSHEDNVKPSSDNLFQNSWKNETQVNLQTDCSMDEKEPALESDNITQQNVERSSSHAQDGNGAHDEENNIICEREKLKETDEYKRAAEEEWASRQRQLQLQAEEAQRLRKRKRAETQRLLEMGRRQKERVEEMRETQKKNVETINLKEQLRAEVRKELDRLELINSDMVSLLRALGIRVGSGFCPTSQEVNAAYKKALLKFHPDRASRTDIRQQVEAEEKFKLVSRLKEKLTKFTTSTPN